MEGKLHGGILPHIRSHKGYVPGVQPSDKDWIKLNTNENPYLCSPSVKNAINGEIDDLRLYSSPDCKSLREAICRRHNVSADQVIVGNGSDDVLNVLARSFCDWNHSIATIHPSYSLYPVLASLQNSKLEILEFSRDFTLPVEQITQSKAGIFFLTSPNAPSGIGYDNNTLRQILTAYSGILVVDEAYADFADENAIELIEEFSNLFITRTFSKSYALAGLRVGYGIGDPELVNTLHGVRDVYNVDRLAQAAAKAAIEDFDHFAESLCKIRDSRAEFSSRLHSRNWFTYPSQTNFVFTEPVDSAGKKGPEVASSLYEFLKTQKILVRYFPNHSLTESFLRVTIGTDSEMETLNRAIDQWTAND